jgi:hypothetical protein
MVKLTPEFLAELRRRAEDARPGPHEIIGSLVSLTSAHVLALLDRIEALEGALGEFADGLPGSDAEYVARKALGEADNDA